MSGKVFDESWLNEDLSSNEYVSFDKNSNKGSKVMLILAPPRFERKEFEGDPYMSAEFEVEVVVEGGENVRKVLDVPKGGENSRYGQLQSIIRRHGSSSGVFVEMAWTGKGKSRRYFLKDVTGSFTGSEGVGSSSVEDLGSVGSD